MTFKIVPKTAAEVVTGPPMWIVRNHQTLIPGASGNNFSDYINVKLIDSRPVRQLVEAIMSPREDDTHQLYTDQCMREVIRLLENENK